MGRTPRSSKEKRREEKRLERIGRRLKALRKAKGLTAQDLADQLGVKPQYIYMIESGRARPTERRLKELATALGDSAEAFLDAAVTQVEAEFADRLRATGLSAEAIEGSAQRMAKRAIAEMRDEKPADSLDLGAGTADISGSAELDDASALSYARSVSKEFDPGVGEPATQAGYPGRHESFSAGPDARIVVQRPVSKAEREALTDVGRIIERLLNS